LFIGMIRFLNSLDGVAMEEVVSAFCWQSPGAAANRAVIAFCFNM
jgi:hypothetical protein